MRPGDFSPSAREAIMEASGHQCVGCGRTHPLNTQHRVARGMGGTSLAVIGHPSNGLVLDGSGSTGCHGWAESHPTWAELLGWRTSRGWLAGGWNQAVWWTRFGWKRWTPDLAVETVDDVNVIDLRDRQLAISAYMDWRDDRGGL